MYATHIFNSGKTVTYSLRQYVGWDSRDAVKHYLARISARIPQFETMEEPELNFIKVCGLHLDFVQLTN